MSLQVSKTWYERYKVSLVASGETWPPQAGHWIDVTMEETFFRKVGDNVVARGEASKLTNESLASMDIDLVTTTGGSDSPASVTAAANQRVLCTAGSITITLPASPTENDTIQVVDISGTAGSSNITVARNGQEIQNSATDLTIDINNASPILNGVPNSWMIGSPSNDDGSPNV